MSNTIILTSEKKSMFMNAGNAEGGRIEIDGQGTFMTVVGDTFVNIEASEDYQEKISKLFVAENLIAEYDISDTSKQHIITLTYNKTYRAVAIIGITDIDLSLRDDQTTTTITKYSVGGVGVKLVRTQVNIPDFIADKVLFLRTEKQPSKAKKTIKKIRAYLLTRK